VRACYGSRHAAIGTASNAFAASCNYRVTPPGRGLLSGALLAANTGVFYLIKAGDGVFPKAHGRCRGGLSACCAICSASSITCTRWCRWRCSRRCWPRRSTPWSAWRS